MNKCFYIILIISNPNFKQKKIKMPLFANTEKKGCYISTFCGHLEKETAKKLLRLLIYITDDQIIILSVLESVNSRWLVNAPYEAIDSVRCPNHTTRAEVALDCLVLPPPWCSHLHHVLPLIASSELMRKPAYRR